MDAKSISNIKSAIPTIKTNTRKDVKSQSSDADRDADGRKSRKEESSRELTEEEMERVLNLIKELPGFKKNNLKVRVVTKNHRQIVHIEDSLGKIIRRINESELCQFLDKSLVQKGQIYSRSA